jgi:hypothetical protein
MKQIPRSTIEWLLESDIPRIRFAAQKLFTPEAAMYTADAGTTASTAHLSKDQLITRLVASLAEWKDEVLKQHNKPDLCMHRLCILADMGVTVDFEPIRPVIETILESFHENDVPTIKILIPRAFRGSGEVERAWIICDYPQILYSLLKMGVRTEQTQRSRNFFAGLAHENGFPCT